MAAGQLILRLLWMIESTAAAIAYAIVACLLIGDVVGRELFGSSLFGAQKMAVYAAVVAGFLGLCLATATNTQLRPVFLDWVIKGPVVDRVGDLLACLFYVAMSVVAFQFIAQSYEFNDRAAVLYWLLWPIQIVIPYALISTGVRHGIFGLWPDLKPHPETEAVR